MVGYRRNKPENPDAAYFLTMATAQRDPWFSTPTDQELALRVMGRIRDRFKLKFMAWAILPDHIHWLISPGQEDYSKIVFAFKRGVGAEFKKISLLSEGGRIWQHRFWEHTIMDDSDYQQCVEYIHYNPVKHSLVKAPMDWQYSSFRKYVARGIYPADWADGVSIDIPGSEYD